MINTAREAVMHFKHLPCGIGAAAFLLAAAGDLSAQFVSGRVIHASTGEPVNAVSVTLRSNDGVRVAHAVTSEDGTFAMQASRVGRYVLTAEHVGMSTVTSQLTISVSEEVEILLRMSESAIALEPLTVEARSFRNIGPLAGYYERVDRSRNIGLGTIITRERIDERRPLQVSDLLREVPRVSVVQSRDRSAVVQFRSGGIGGCSPRVYVDGVMANRNAAAAVDELVHPLDLEGVEVYQGLAQSPGEYHDVSGCGVVLLWTRRMPDGGEPLTWKRLVAGLAAVGLIVLLAN